jgi:hypothetical protein
MGHFLIERLVRLCLLQPALHPFMESTSWRNVIKILMGFSELELVGFVLCLYLAAAALYEIFKR